MLPSELVEQSLPCDSQQRAVVEANNGHHQTAVGDFKLGRSDRNLRGGADDGGKLSYTDGLSDYALTGVFMHAVITNESRQSGCVGGAGVGRIGRAVSRLGVEELIVIDDVRQQC